VREITERYQFNSEGAFSTCSVRAMAMGCQ